MSTPATLDLLLKRFDSAIFIPAREAASLRYILSAGNCSFPTVKIGSLRQVCVLDFAGWIDSARRGDAGKQIVVAADARPAAFFYRDLSASAPPAIAQPGAAK